MTFRVVALEKLDDTTGKITLKFKGPTPYESVLYHYVPFVELHTFTIGLEFILSAA